MATQQEIQDAALSGMAKTALALDPEVDLNDVWVDTANGVVRLQGVVDTYDVKQRAEDAVRRLPGVQGVDNALAVEASADLHDDDISQMIEDAFANESSLDASHMGAKVTDGVAHLTGWVDNPNQEKTAIHLANSIEGVKDVFSELKMRRSGPSDDVTIHNDVMQMLNQADDLDSMYIDLSVEEAEVTLLGEVPNTTQYSRAEELAGSVPGVRKIHNRLTITGVS